MLNKHLVYLLITFFTIPCIAEVDMELIMPYHELHDTLDVNLKDGMAIYEFHLFVDGFQSHLIYKMDEGENTQAQIIDNRFEIMASPGAHSFEFYYSKNYFEISLDSVPIANRHRKALQLNFQSSEMPIMVKKPVIYLYSKAKVEVEMSIDVKGSIDFTYPEYDDRWLVNVEADQLEVNGKQHSYLFWDGKFDFDFNQMDLNKGFVVRGADVVDFLNEQLSTMNFEFEEREDFITFWAPEMSKKERVFIHFLFNEDYNHYAEMLIHPKPDNLYRVFMLWSDVSDYDLFDVVGQKIPSFQRSGFHILDWGGAEFDRTFPMSYDLR